MKVGSKGKITILFTTILLVVSVVASFLTLVGVQPVSAPSSEIIVDNHSASFVGSWPTSTYLSGYYGSDYQYNGAGSGADTVTWSFIIPSVGSWEVFARWTSDGNRATDAPYTVYHADGSTTVDKNQEVNGGSWQSLGTYSFDAAAYNVSLTDNANDSVIADAIRVARASNVEVKVDGEIVTGLISIEFDVWIKEPAGLIGIDERIGITYADVNANGTIRISHVYPPFDTMLFAGYHIPFQLVIDAREDGQSIYTIYIDECYLIGKTYYSDDNAVESQYYFVGSNFREYS